MDLSRFAHLRKRVVSTLLLVTILSVTFFVGQPLVHSAGPPYTWTGPTDVNSALGQDQLPAALQATNGTLWLVWQTFRFSSTRPDLIWRTLWNNTWSSVGRLTSSGINTSPAIAQLKNGTVIIFYSTEFVKNFNIYYQKYTVNQFGIGCCIGPTAPTVHLTITTAYNDTSPSATVGYDGTLWLFWQRTNQSCAGTCSQTKQIWYETMKNGFWGPETKITSDNNWNWLPSAVVTKDSLVRLFYSKYGQSVGATLTSSRTVYRSYNGAIWSGETNVTSPGTGFSDQHPSTIQDRNGTIWLVWSRTSQSTPQFVLFNRFCTAGSSCWTTGGTSWSAESQMVNEAVGIDDQQPVIVQGYSNTNIPINNDRGLHIFYSSDRTNNDYDIWTLVSNSVSPVHDVGVTSISPGDTLMYGGGLASIGQSANTTIGVTVVNYGDFNESVLVSVTVSNTTSYLLQGQTRTILVKSSAGFTYAWNTTNAKAARYTIAVTAIETAASETAGNNGDNNVQLKSAIHLLPWGDLDRNGIVSLTDVSVCYFDFGFTPATPSRWEPLCDINNNQIIDIIDAGIVTRNFGIPS